MRPPTALLLFAALLSLLSCGSEALLIEKNPRPAREKRGAFFLPYHFVSNITSTRLNSEDENEETGNGDLLFSNRGILQFSFHSQLRRSVTNHEVESLQAEKYSTQKGTEQVEESIAQEKIESDRSVAKQETSHDRELDKRSVGLDTDSHSQNVNSIRSSHDLTREESEDNVASNVQVENLKRDDSVVARSEVDEFSEELKTAEKPLAQLDRTDSDRTGRRDEKSPIEGKKVATVQNPGRISSRVIPGETKEMVQVPTRGETENTVDRSGDTIADLETDKTVVEGTIEEKEQKIETNLEGKTGTSDEESIVSETSSTGETGGLTGIRTGQESDTSSAVLKRDEDSHELGFRRKVRNLDPGQDSRTFSPTKRESSSELNVEYWRATNETIFNILKHDRTLQHFRSDSKKEYLVRLRKETSEQARVLRLEKKAPTTVAMGEPIEFRFELENLTGSPEYAGDRTTIENIVIIDFLDTGLLYDGEYAGEITSGTFRFTFSNEDNIEQNLMPEFTTSAEWNDGKIAWIIPGVVRPGDTLTFSFRASYFLETGLISTEIPLTTDPGGGQTVAVLDPDRTAVRVIERNSEKNWLRVSVRTKDPDKTSEGYIPFDRFESISEDDVDRERKFMEINWAVQIKKELASGKGRIRKE